MKIITFPWSRLKETFQLAEVISEETALRQENRKMSVIIAEAQTVIHLIITIFAIIALICYHSSACLLCRIYLCFRSFPSEKKSFTFTFNKEVNLQHEWSTGWPSETDETNICQVKLQIERTRPVWYVSNMKNTNKKCFAMFCPLAQSCRRLGNSSHTLSNTTLNHTDDFRGCFLLLRPKKWLSVRLHSKSEFRKCQNFLRVWHFMRMEQ